jgi:CHAD domain-containing protein
MKVENERVTPSGRLALPADGSLRTGLVAAFAGILAYAAAQTGADPAGAPGADPGGAPGAEPAGAPGAEPAGALHEYRKSVRRARALLRLMEGVVGVDAYDRLTTTLREVHRASSGLRDRQVLLDVMQGAGPCASDAGAVVAASLGAAMGGEAAPSAAEVAEVIAAGSARLAPLPELLAGAMPRKVSWDAVADGLARTFRRARRRLHAVELHGDDESLHGLRKRTKELNYQVELFAELGGRARKQRKQLAELCDELGQLADLIVLRGYAETHLASAGEQARVIAAIAGERASQLGHALEHAGEVLDRRPRSFARKIVRVARKRRA